MKLSGTKKLTTYAIFGCMALCQFSVAGENKPLESYPKVDRIWMGTEEGSIRPAAYQQVRSTIDGYFALKAKDGQLLKKGELWAIIDPEEIEIERKSLDLEKAKLQQQADKTAGETLEAQIRLALDIHEAEGKRQTLIDASQNTSIPAELRKRAGDSISKIDERLRMLKKRASPKTLKRNVELEETEGELAIEKKQKQFLALKKRSFLVAEFDGELRLSDSVKKAVADRKEPDALLWVASNEHLATVVNDSKYEIVVKATSPILSQIKREDILVFLQEPQTGRLIGGDYARTDEIDTGGEIIQNYVFNIQGASIQDARHSSGQTGLVHIYRKFSTPVRLIFKKDIAFAESDILASRGWDGLVMSLWPGSTVLQVAPQTIAVRPKNDN
jgi:hypothetical protein